VPGRSPGNTLALVRQRIWIVTVSLSGLAGFVLLTIPGGGVQEVIGCVLLGFLLVVVIGVVVGRLGPQSQPDREREARAREEFDRTGEWPAD
jgi:hypothetical protein